MAAIRLAFNQVWVFGLLALLSACVPKEESASAEERLYATFEELPSTDTLHIDLDTMSLGEAISFEAFFSAIDSVLLQSLIYEPDSVDGLLQALWKVPLDTAYDLCVFELRQNWFQFRYGLLYAKNPQAFTDLQPLAYYYGGEGGQIFSESWLINQETLIVSEVERSIRWTPEGETQESTQTRLSAKVWSSPQFRSVAIPDSVYWAQKATFFQY